MLLMLVLVLCVLFPDALGLVVFEASSSFTLRDSGTSEETGINLKTKKRYTEYIFTKGVEAAMVEHIPAGKLLQLLHEFELLSEEGDVIELCLVHEPPDPTDKHWQAADLLGVQVVADLSE